MVFYNRAKFYAFSTIFGDFMGGGWNPPPPHLVSPKKPAPGRVKANPNTKCIAILEPTSMNYP